MVSSYFGDDLASQSLDWCKILSQPIKWLILAKLSASTTQKT